MSSCENPNMHHVPGMQASLLEPPQGSVWGSNAIAQYLARQGDRGPFGNTKVEEVNLAQASAFEMLSCILAGTALCLAMVEIIACATAADQLCSLGWTLIRSAQRMVVLLISLELPSCPAPGSLHWVVTQIAKLPCASPMH